jgi:hypothetical protein
VAVTVPGGTALCGALPSIPVSGTGTVGVVTGFPASVGFDLVCNAGADTQTVSLGNSGSGNYDFTASIGPGWSVSPTSGTVAPAKTVTLTITSTSASSPATPGTASNATLTVTTDIPGDAAHNATMAGTVEGATLSFVDASGAAQPSISVDDFLDASGNLTASSNVLNSGNLAESVDYVVVPSASNPDASPSFSVSFGGSVSAGGTTPITYTWTPKASVTPFLTTYTYDVYVPGSNGEAGICSAQTFQVVQFTWNVIT